MGTIIETDGARNARLGQYHGDRRQPSRKLCNSKAWRSNAHYQHVRQLAEQASDPDGGCARKRSPWLTAFDAWWAAKELADAAWAELPCSSSQRQLAHCNKLQAAADALDAACCDAELNASGGGIGLDDYHDGNYIASLASVPKERGTTAWPEMVHGLSME